MYKESMSSSTGASVSNKNQLRQRRKERVLKGLDKLAPPLLPSNKVETQKRNDWFISVLLTLWACYIRLWKISQPASVVFDEVHFGGFASKYINKKFFMDVHPPLAKMMIAWTAQVVGFNGSFDFKEIGTDYLSSHVPYVPIRVFCALNGILLVPMSYWTIRSSGFSVKAAILTAFMICYENGLVTNNRLILLDSILLFFTGFTLLMWINFRNQIRQQFTTWWWVWLAMTGIGLGLTVSCKWVGLFTIATIGVAVLKELWDLWGDHRTEMSTFIYHFIARTVCLIILPCCIYMACFLIHFGMLPESGSGTNFMSPEFQTSLEGIKFPQTTPADIVYGSKIDIRHMGTSGGYLHSHDHAYPGGSRQQQVTLYSHVDNNNWWVINKANTDDVRSLEYVRHGDIVRLTHFNTKRRLHTHDIRPTTNDEKYQYEVSGYGFEGFEGDSNDNWRVEIEEGPDPVARTRLRTRRSQFRLVSETQKCALFSRKYKLPDWGFKQQEVTCMKDAKLPKTIWEIESTESDFLPEGSEAVSYKSKGFFGKFLELNKVMWQVNQGLSSAHTYASRPKDWPILRRGISFWSKDHRKIYLLGNPLVFWSSTACIITYVALKLVTLLFLQRKIITDTNRWRKYDGAVGFFFVSWALHYFPFNLMTRQLFLHHYMPSLYMAILVTGAFFDLLTSSFRNPVRWSLLIICVMAVVYVYTIFIPITYGEPWTTSACSSATWRPDWDFNCKM
ncbi:glycosyltransferase family 39 protein [Thamnidium elegans]|nr:glycosyltransferase family 39 protein [Thamnidium elegans]